MGLAVGLVVGLVVVVECNLVWFQDMTQFAGVDFVVPSLVVSIVVVVVAVAYCLSWCFGS